MRGDGEQMLGGLISAHHVATLDELPGTVAKLTAPVGFTHPQLYVADLQGQFLVPLPRQCDLAGEALQRLRIDGTLAGRAYRTLQIVVTEQGWWLPLLDGTERIGVMFTGSPGDDETTRWRASQLASLIAMIIANKRSTSDTYSQLVRTQPMRLSAEMLWTMLPMRTFATDEVVVSAALEPAYMVGGDAFDYAASGDSLHVAIFDAMGHDTTSGLTAAIAMGACRNSRRQGVGLVETAQAIDEAIAEQFDRSQFATGVLAHLDTATGHLTWVNRGHHPPLVLRRGRLVATLETPPDPPMGFGLGTHQPLARYQLEPGDRLLLYTDGIIEARNPGGEVFGLDRFVDFVIRREADEVAAPETLRRLIQTLLEHQEDHLQDDATVVLVEWRTRQHLRLVL